MHPIERAAFHRAGTRTVHAVNPPKDDSPRSPRSTGINEFSKMPLSTNGKLQSAALEMEISRYTRYVY